MTLSAARRWVEVDDEMLRAVRLGADLARTYERDPGEWDRLAAEALEHPETAQAALFGTATVLAMLVRFVQPRTNAASPADLMDHLAGSAVTAFESVHPGGTLDD